MFHIVHIVTNRTRLKPKPHRLSLLPAAAPAPPSTLSEDLEESNTPPPHPESPGHRALNDLFVHCVHFSAAGLRRYGTVHNVDGSQNDNGMITEEARMLLRIGDHTESACLAVTNLGRQTVIIGHSWLHHHNPEVDWQSGKVIMSRCPSGCYPASHSVKDDVNSVELEEGDTIYAVSLPADYAQGAATIAVTQTPSQRMAQNAHTSENRALPELLPSHCHHTSLGITLLISCRTLLCRREKHSHCHSPNKRNLMHSYVTT